MVYNSNNPYPFLSLIFGELRFADFWSINITTKNILQNYCVFVNVEFIIKSKERSELYKNEVKSYI